MEGMGSASDAKDKAASLQVKLDSGLRSHCESLAAEATRFSSITAGHPHVSISYLQISNFVIRYPQHHSTSFLVFAKRALR